MAKLTEKQKRFCEEYIKDYNGTQSYIRAGYATTNPNSARVEASKLLTNPNIKHYIGELTDNITKDNIADAKEIREFLTSVLRGEEEEENAMAINKGDFIQEIEKVKTQVKAKDRLKAADMLSKMLGIDKPEEKKEMEGVKIEW